MKLLWATLNTIVFTSSLIIIYFCTKQILQLITEPPIRGMDSSPQMRAIKVNQGKNSISWVVLPSLQEISVHIKFGFQSIQSVSSSHWLRCICVISILIFSTIDCARFMQALDMQMLNISQENDCFTEEELKRTR